MQVRLWCLRAVIQRAVCPERVAFQSPLFNEHLNFCLPVTERLSVLMGIHPFRRLSSFVRIRMLTINHHLCNTTLRDHHKSRFLNVGKNVFFKNGPFFSCNVILQDLIFSFQKPKGHCIGAYRSCLRNMSMIPLGDVVPGTISGCYYETL